MGKILIVIVDNDKPTCAYTLLSFVYLPILDYYLVMPALVL